jgi:gliding motility associated protien GldN
MRPIYYISAIILLLAFSQESFAQQQRRQRPSQATIQDNTPTLTERAKIKNEVNSQTPAHVVWLREMYRYIHLDREANAPLLYPTEPIGDRQNLFTLLFRLVLDEKVNAYNYMDGKEIFNESQKINIEDLLKKQQILYTTQGSKHIVDEIDIPSSEVLIYMIKEAWYFDQATGLYKSQVLALCPLLVRMDYYTSVVNTEALFWVTYEDIRPYISREMIMTSNYNNTLAYTIDDYFTKGMYDGEIVKTVNLMNMSLAQEVGENPEALKVARDSIEAQLKGFEKQLWFQPDTTQIAVDDKKEKKAASSARRTTKVEKPKAEKAEKPKSSEKSSSSPTRSVRRTR